MIALTVLYTALLLAQAESAEPYEWPLEQPRALTSSFAEYRSDRFHMGIDLRTGPIGKKVVAAGDGYVSRIRCSPYGYGKAIYVQLDDGNTAIYAHLNDFIPSLNTYVREIQHRRKSYTVDLYPDKGVFRVQRGQLIGYSGQTGIGVPHLHWEIRDRSGAPINPRALGIEWPDNTTPRFRSVLLIPATPDTTINGDFLPVVLAVTRTGDGAYRAASARVHGRVTLGVDVYDPANQGASKLGVYRVTTTADDELIFRMTHDRVSYLHSSDGVVAYHPYYRSEGKFLMQWPWPGIETELYAKSAGTGEIQVDENTRTVRVEASDFFNHSSSLTLQLNPDSGSATPLSSDSTTDNGTGTVFYNAVGDWLVVSAQFTAPESITPLLLESGKKSNTIFTRVSATTFRARYRPAPGLQYTGISIHHPRAGRDGETQLPLEHRFALPHAQNTTTHYIIGDLIVDIQAQQLYQRLYITAGRSAAKSDGELVPVGNAYNLWPEHAPLRKSIQVSIPLPEDSGTGLGVYRKKGTKWKWVKSNKKNGTLTFSTRKLGTFQLMTDSVGPEILFKRPAKSSTVTSTKPEIRIHIKDVGSTIKSWDVRFRDEWLLMAYDPEQDVLIWEQDKPLRSGMGELIISVKDEAGNTRTKRLSMTVP